MGRLFVCLECSLLFSSLAVAAFIPEHYTPMSEPGAPKLTWRKTARGTSSLPELSMKRAASDSASTHLGPIIGGVLGCALVISVVIFVMFKHRQKKRRAVAAINGPPIVEQYGSNLSEKSFRIGNSEPSLPESAVDRSRTHSLRYYDERALSPWLEREESNSLPLNHFAIPAATATVASYSPPQPSFSDYHFPPGLPQPPQNRAIDAHILPVGHEFATLGEELETRPQPPTPLHVPQRGHTLHPRPRPTIPPTSPSSRLRRVSDINTRPLPTPSPH